MKSLVSNDTPKMTVNSPVIMFKIQTSQLVFEPHVMIICFYAFLQRDVPPRDESHKSTLALVSIDMRNESSHKSDALLISLSLSKTASVSETFLSGLAFCTRRRQKPKRFRILLMDFSQGSSSCAQPFWVIKASRMALAVMRVYLNMSETWGQSGFQAQPKQRYRFPIAVFLASVFLLPRALKSSKQTNPVRNSFNPSATVLRSQPKVFSAKCGFDSSNQWPLALETPAFLRPLIF